MADLERTCYISNINKDVTADILEELFIQAGPVAKVIHRDVFALIIFEDDESVLFAVELLDGVRLFGQPISVKPKENTGQFEKYRKWLPSRPRYPEISTAPPPPPHHSHLNGVWSDPGNRYPPYPPRSHAGSYQPPPPPQASNHHRYSNHHQGSANMPHNNTPRRWHEPQRGGHTRRQYY